MRCHTLRSFAAICLSLSFCASSFPALSQADKPSVLTYVYPDQSVWTTKLDARGEPDNPLLRVAAKLFAEAGIPWQGQSLPAARMFEYLRDGKAQFSMLVNAPALSTCCLVGKEAVTGTDLRVYRLADTPPVKTKEDFIGKSVILIHGYSYAGLLNFFADEKNKVNSSRAETHEAAFTMLKHKRADYVLDYAGPAAETLAAYPIANLQSEPLSRLDVYLVLSRAYPNAEQLMSRLEAIVKTLDVDAIMRGETSPVR
jgi:polar amino acid transport system substrate-binding protein